MGTDLPALGMDLLALGMDLLALGKDLLASGMDLPASGMELPALGMDLLWWLAFAEGMGGGVSMDLERVGEGQGGCMCNVAV